METASARPATDGTPGRADAAGRGLAISASISTAAPVLGDARLLQRLTANLIDNAIRYNIPHGRISIQVTTSGGQPRIEIINTGPVIPAGQTTRLLQPFQRRSATRSATRAADGEGLGLSIVAAIAKAHNATLTINPGPRRPVHRPRPRLLPGPHRNQPQAPQPHPADPGARLHRRPHQGRITPYRP